MKRFKIFFTPNYFAAISFPILNRSEKLTSLIRFLFSFETILLFSFFTLVPLSGILGFSGSMETDQFKFILFFIVLLYIVYFVIVALNGRVRLNDPAQFLNILVFALLTTTASVFVVPASISNTFGVSTMRGLSGVFVMCAIGLFYIVNVLISDKVLIKRTIYSLTIGFFLYFLYLLFSSYGSRTLIADNIINVAPLFILVSGILLFSKLPKISIFSILVLISLLTIFSFNGYTGTYQNLYSVLASIALSGGLLSIFFIVINKKYIKNRVKELKSRKILNNQTRIKLAFPLITLATPLLVVVLGFTLDLLTKQRFLEVFTSINDLGAGITNIFNNTSTGSSQLVSVLFGLGGRALNPSFTLLANIISTQGIVGSIAYLFLGAVSIYFGFKLLKKTIFTNRDYKLIVLFLFVMLYVVFMSLFTYPGILTVILWWISFALLAAYSKVQRDVIYIKDLVYTRISKLIVAKESVNMQYILSICVVFFGIIILIALSRIQM